MSDLFKKALVCRRLKNTEKLNIAFFRNFHVFLKPINNHKFL